MPFPDSLHDTFPPTICARSRFAAITTSICRQITYICRHIYIDLAANRPRSRTTSPPFPHGTHTVPARHLRRTRTTPLRLSRRRNNLSFLAEDRQRLASPVPVAGFSLAGKWEFLVLGSVPADTSSCSKVHGTERTCPFERNGHVPFDATATFIIFLIFIVFPSFCLLREVVAKPLFRAVCEPGRAA